MINLIQGFQNFLWTPGTNVRQGNKIEWHNCMNIDQFNWSCFWTEGGIVDLIC